jgi:DNA-binding PadR family transcriptional regulator
MSNCQTAQGMGGARSDPKSLGGTPQSQEPAGAGRPHCGDAPKINSKFGPVDRKFSGGNGMRTLKYAILGLLCRGTLAGYDLAKAFDTGLGSFWNASHSQIYPELKKLLAEGLVDCSTVILGTKLKKKMYTITKTGHEDFLEWLRRDEPLDPTPKDKFRLRIYLSDMISDDELLRHLKAQLLKRRQKLERLNTQFDYNFSNLDPAGFTKIQRGDYLVLRGAIMRETAYINWLQSSIAFVTQ